MYRILEEDCYCPGNTETPTPKSDKPEDICFGGGICFCPCHTLSVDEKQKFVEKKFPLYGFPPNCL